MNKTGFDAKERILGELSAEEGAIRYHEARRAQLQKDLAAIEAAARLEMPRGIYGGDPEFESKLEKGSWKEAASKKCDYWRDAPADLVAGVRAAKGGIKGAAYHFTASNTEPTLFRFRRKNSG